MKTLRTLHLMGLIGCVGLTSCSSSKKDESDDPNNGGFKTGGEQVAQNTADGRAPISEATATSLTNSGNACAQWNETPMGSQPILEFVIDASGSMGQDPANPSNPNGPTKWEVFADTMPGVFASLPANFAVGVSYYNKASRGNFIPNQAVPIGILDAAQQTRIAQSIQNTTPGGYTPTYNAWLAGRDALAAWQAPSGYENSPPYIVLITDGVPTVTSNGSTIQNPITQAEYDAQLALIRQQQGDVLKTFVVGVVGSENPQDATYDPLYMLSQLAVIGKTAPAGCVPKSGTPAGTTVSPRGTYCHFDLSQANDFATALTASLGSIVQSVVSCDYAVPHAPAGKVIDPNQIVMVYSEGNGKYSLILQNTSSTCDKGWQFTDGTNSQIRICGATCDLIQKNPDAALNLVFGCGVDQIIN